MLAQIAVEATRVVLILFIILGTIGNVLNLFIFTRPTLLKSPCTLYLLAASIDNILVIYTTLLTRLLANGFSIDITITSNAVCKLRSYVGYVFFAVSPYFFVLACFDRYCSSSPLATYRSWSNKKVAKRLIIGAITLACILYFHMAIFFEIQSGEGGLSCNCRPGIYTIFWRIFYLIVMCILPAFFMGLFCILTLMNMRRQSRRIRHSLATGNYHRTQMDRQLLRMLFIQVSTQLLCILPTAIINLLNLFTDIDSDLFNFFSQIFILTLYVSYSTSFYVFTMSSRLYQNELFKIISLKKYIKNRQEIMVIKRIMLHPNIH
ncbi:unnamed protein product [Adineta steineri]|uniref:G-protein coupled receptors family 1 profile domain-containing protein n=1 Tax=Adineta steineri TaxID=433720 RepID=A0A819UGE2_9BILA|nr:unnamed protein product [Adineta steineri]CAF4094671.1 unnamed protein product [Adineta steineri]